ncbi:hypothetical protein FA95DRAFT_1477837, partial [Auriscalpium vulgare]
ERASVASLLSILDSRINASAPVSRLPSELLVAIFTCSEFAEIEWYEHVQEHVQQAPRTVPWVRFSHVCRRWRHVMLTSPSLWRNLILPLPPQWARAMIARSQQLPLTISYTRNRSEISSEWNLPLDTLERVKSINLLHADSCPANLDALLCTPAPILEVANLYRSTPAQIRLTPLFADCAPKLRELVMHDAPAIPWTSSFICNLVSLNI